MGRGTMSMKHVFPTWDSPRTTIFSGWGLLEWERSIVACNAEMLGPQRESYGGHDVEWLSR